MDIKNKSAWMAVFVAALGYFVDVFDMFIFSATRKASLADLGLRGEQIVNEGIYLLNCQMVGMLIGGVIWGIIGDKYGRLKVLFGSIILYSLGNILNSFVTDTFQFSIVRFLTGVGLAGEVGAGITLVAELLPKESRGIGVMIVACCGVMGPVLAGIVSELVTWRTAYLIGGIAGLSLLVLRVSVVESSMFESVNNSNVLKGSLDLLFKSKERVIRFIHIIMIGTPVWFTAGILVALSPEIASALGLEGVTASKSMIYFSIGMTTGDLASGLISQIFKSRRKVILCFLIAGVVSNVLFLNSINLSLTQFYISQFGVGLVIGYWALFLATSAELFGTNLRATVSTSVPNIVRATIVPLTFIIQQIKPTFGFLHSVEILGVVCFGLAIYGVLRCRETFGIDLNYLEE